MQCSFVKCIPIAAQPTFRTLSSCKAETLYPLNNSPTLPPSQPLELEAFSPPPSHIFLYICPGMLLSLWGHAVWDMQNCHRPSKEKMGDSDRGVCSCCFVFPEMCISSCRFFLLFFCGVSGKKRIAFFSTLLYHVISLNRCYS